MGTSALQLAPALRVKVVVVRPDASIPPATQRETLGHERLISCPPPWTSALTVCSVLQLAPALSENVVVPAGTTPPVLASRPFDPTATHELALGHCTLIRGPSPDVEGATSMGVAHVTAPFVERQITPWFAAS
jgi:hypothetical protein